MKIFAIGSDNTSNLSFSLGISKEIESSNVLYYDFNWMESNSFDYVDYLQSGYKLDINLTYDYYNLHINNDKYKNHIIANISNPKDFINLFDHSKDKVIMINNLSFVGEDIDVICLSTSRDYCFWLASANLLPKESWIEYTFKDKGEDKEIKKLGAKNSIFTVGNLQQAINHFINC